MYYSFTTELLEDQAAFEARMENLCREIGDRGRGKPQATGAKLQLPEAVPPAPAPAPAPVARATAPGRAPAPVAPQTPMQAPPPNRNSGFTPSLQPSPSSAAAVAAAAPPHSLALQPAGSFEAMSTFLEKQQDKMVGLLREERAAFDAKLEKLREDLAPAPPTEVVSEGQVTALQERIERLHASKLFKDEELFAVEDVVSDFVEVRMQVGIVTQEIASANPVAGAMKHLVGLSEALASDAAFSRQLRRKFL